MRSLSKSAIQLVSTAIVVCLCARCPAQFSNWEGSGTNGITADSSGDFRTHWHTSLNWDDPPGQFDVAELEFTNQGRVFVSTTSKVSFIYLRGTVPDAILTIVSGANLTVSNSLYVPITGRGEVGQYGGTLTANSIFIGDNTGQTGRYQFDNGTITVQKLLVGLEGDGTFVHNGGQLNVPDRMLLGPGGRYDSFGGTLNMTGRMVSDGTIDFHNRTTTLSLPASRLTDISGTLVNAANLTVNLPSSSLLVLPAGFNPATQLKNVSGGGRVHIRGNTLVVGAGTSYAGPEGEFRDPIDIAGQLTTVGNAMWLAGGGVLHPGGAINYAAKQLLLSGGEFDLGGGTIVAQSVSAASAAHVTQAGTGLTLTGSLAIGSNADYVYESGSISAQAISVGNGGEFTSTAPLLSGVNSITSSFGGPVTFAGGGVDVPLLRSNRGNFRQISGHTAADEIQLIDGQYELQGGSLTVGRLQLQNDLPGQFIISNPAVPITITESLEFGPDAALEGLTAAPGTVITMQDASFLNRGASGPRSPIPVPLDARDNLRTLEMAFRSVTDGITSTIEAAAEDRGAVPLGLSRNYTIGTLRLGGVSPAHVQLVDEIQNLCRTFTCPPPTTHDVLYVDHLILHENAELDLNGIRLYYGQLTDLGGQVLANGGALLPVVYIPGDFSGDGRVDAGDYTIWRNGLGTKYTEADYAVWRAHYGESVPSGAASHATVPEAANIVLVVTGLLIVSYGRKQRR